MFTSPSTSAQATSDDKLKNWLPIPVNDAKGAALDLGYIRSMSLGDAEPA